MNHTLRLIPGTPEGEAAPEPRGGSAQPAAEPTPLDQRLPRPASGADPLVSNTIPDFQAGERALVFGSVVDQYRIERLIATGGTSRVYRATHQFMGHLVALKVLNESFARRPDLLERFKKEALALKKIHSENIVDIDGVGLTERGEPYIAMEFIDGGSLRDRLDGGWRPSVLEVVSILIAVTDGVEAAHRLTIVHRDLKPDNILCGKDGVVKVVDFGLARFADAKRTDAKGVFGTAAYIAPERLNGMPGDVRSDIYSLGLVAYELLTGKNPMLGDRRLSQGEVAANQVAVVPPRLWKVPDDLADAVARAIEKRPPKRFASMSEFGATLRMIRKSLLDAEAIADRARAEMAADEARTRAATATLATRAREGKSQDSAVRKASARRSLVDEMMRGSLRVPLAVGAMVGVTAAVSVYAIQRSGHQTLRSAPETAGFPATESTPAVEPRVPVAGARAPQASNPPAGSTTMAPVAAPPAASAVAAAVSPETKMTPPAGATGATREGVKQEARPTTDRGRPSESQRSPAPTPGKTAETTAKKPAPAPTTKPPATSASTKTGPVDITKIPSGLAVDPPEAIRLPALTSEIPADPPGGPADILPTARRSVLDCAGFRNGSGYE